MYQIIVLSTIGFLTVIGLAAFLVDWDSVGYKYFPDTFKAPDEK